MLVLSLKAPMALEHVLCCTCRSHDANFSCAKVLKQEVQLSYSPRSASGVIVLCEHPSRRKARTEPIPSPQDLLIGCPPRRAAPIGQMHGPQRNRGAPRAIQHDFSDSVEPWITNNVAWEKATMQGKPPSANVGDPRLMYNVVNKPHLHTHTHNGHDSCLPCVYACSRTGSTAAPHTSSTMASCPIGE
jgi:S-adenosylmethionine/arginine decarboxylase-like enzyme